MQIWGRCVPAVYDVNMHVDKMSKNILTHKRRAVEPAYHVVCAWCPTDPPVQGPVSHTICETCYDRVIQSHEQKESI